jgi:hypothetical protein
LQQRANGAATRVADAQRGAQAHNGTTSQHAKICVYPPPPRVNWLRRDKTPAAGADSAAKNAD